MTMFRKWAAIGLVLLGYAAGTSASELVLTFSDKPQPKGKVYGTTASPALPTVSTLAGQTVVVRKERGRDFQLRAMPGTWSRFGTQVEQVARDVVHLAVTPTLEGNLVTLEIEYMRKEGDDTLNYQGSASGPLGQWIRLLADPASPNTASSKSYSAGSSSEQLSVKVERR